MGEVRSYNSLRPDTEVHCGAEGEESLMSTKRRLSPLLDGRIHYQGRQSMRLIVTSYTHGLHDQIGPLSDGEVIAHAAGTFENDDTRFIPCRLPQRAEPAGIIRVVDL